MRPRNISLKGKISTFFRWNLKRESYAQTSVRAAGTYARLATNSSLTQGFCILGWETPKERAAETGMPMSSIYYKANLFDQAGMASLLPPAPPPEIPKQDKRSLPPHIRQEIVDLHTQYPAFRPHEIATI